MKCLRCGSIEHQRCINLLELLDENPPLVELFKKHQAKAFSLTHKKRR